MEGNRLLDIEQRLRSQRKPVTKMLSLGKKYASAYSYPAGKAWPGKRVLPAANTPEYWALDKKIKETMISFAEKYINQVSRNSSIPLKERLDINSVGGKYGWLACKDFFVLLIMMAFKKLDIPFHYLAEKRRDKELLYVSSADGASIDLMIRYSKMYIGFLKKYTESVNRNDVRVGDVFLHIGGYVGATGHVRFVTKVFKRNNETWVRFAEGHRSPNNSNVQATSDFGKEAQLPEFSELALRDIVGEGNLHTGGIVRIKWELLWKENAFQKFSSYTKINYVKKHYSSKSSTIQRMLKNDEFYNVVMKKIGSY
jgi:hypothetical protein